MQSLEILEIDKDTLITVSAQIERRRSINFSDFKLPFYLNLNKVPF